MERSVEVLDADSFGKLLRGYRMKLGLSQESLVEKSGLGNRTISALELGEKTRPHFDTVHMLADALDLSPAERAAFLTAARSQPFAIKSATFRTVGIDLPVPPTPLVGRHAEIKLIATLLRQDTTRQLTLTGPGGVGKTRLALQVSSDPRLGFDGDAVFIELAAVRSADLVLTTIAQALGVREEPRQSLLETVRNRVRDRRLLLVLDNCEHVLSGVQSFVAGISATCPGVKILATSRSPLRMRGEQLLQVPQLTLPVLDHLPQLEDLGQIDAVALFVQRARAVRADFALSDANAPDVAEICLRLDGIPLAIELAAARMRLLSPAALLALLNERLRLLVGGPIDAPVRHQMLETTIAWSYDLLNPDEQALFRRLAVLVGGCTLEAAMAVVATDDEIAMVAGLEALADQSLLLSMKGFGSERRFGMLETIREFALQRLSAEDEEPEVRARHAAYFLDIAERGEQELTGPDQATWVKRLDAEHDNFRASLAWLLEQPDQDVSSLELSAALWRYWDRRGHLREGRSWLGQALSATDKAASLPRADALMGLANLSFEDHSRQRALYAESLALFEELGDKPGQARALTGLGLIAMDVGDYIEANLRFGEALAIWRTEGDSRGEATALLHLGRLLGDKGEYDHAQQLHQQSLAICQDLQDAELVGYNHLQLGRMARRQRQSEAAKPYLDRALTISRDVGNSDAAAYALLEKGLLALQEGNPRKTVRFLSEAMSAFVKIGNEHGTVECLDGCARIAWMSNKPTEALQLFSTATTWRESIAANLPPLEMDVWNHDIATIRAELGDEKFSAIWIVGKTWSLTEATDLAFDLLGAVHDTNDDGVGEKSVERAGGVV